MGLRNQSSLLVGMGLCVYIYIIYRSYIYIYINVNYCIGHEKIRVCPEMAGYTIFFTSTENMREKYGDLEPPVLPNMATYCIVAVCAGAEPNNLQPGSRRCKRCHMMCLVAPLSKKKR